MNYKVIDNFLEEEYFNSLAAILEKIPWYFRSTEMSEQGITEDNIFYLYHLFYTANAPTTPNYDKLIPVLYKLGGEVGLIRIKANLYPNTKTLHEHPMHSDFPFSHTSAILSLNTCDGYTKLVDGTKIASVANRVLVFDSSEKHCSTTTTNISARFNINFNYFITNPKLQKGRSWKDYKELQHPELREFIT